ncbi:MAG: DoxX family protein [Acidimicrobiales bacterium]
MVIAGLVGLAFTASGAMKVAGNPAAAEGVTHVAAGTLLRPIGLLEIAGGLGTVVGLALPIVGVAASAGLTAMMAAAR